MTAIRDEVSDLLREVVGVPPPAGHVDLIESGLIDSLALISLLAELEQAFSIEIPLEDLSLQDIQTLDRLVSLVERLPRRDAGDRVLTAHPLVVSLREGGGRPPLFLFPNVMGAPLALRPLALALETDRPIYGLAPLAHEHRTPGLGVEEIAEHYVAAVRAHGDPRGCVIGGVSFGGLVAFEVARRLRDAGEEIGRLLLLDTRPAARSLGPTAYAGFRLLQPLHVLRDVVPDLRSRAPEAIRRARGLLNVAAQTRLEAGFRPPPPREQAVVADPAQEDEAWSRFAHQAGQAYRPGRYGGDVSLYVTARRPLSTFKPESVWSRVIDGDLTIHGIPGTHLDFLRDGWLEGMAVRLSTVL